MQTVTHINENQGDSRDGQQAQYYFARTEAPADDAVQNRGKKPVVEKLTTIDVRQREILP